LSHRLGLKLLVAVGSLFFLICILPTSSFMPTVDLFVERRAYLPSAGIYFAVAGAVTWFLTFKLTVQKRALAPLLITALLAAVILGTQTFATIQRIGVYSSNERLWQEAIEQNPLNRRAKFNLISYYSASKNYDAARGELEKMLVEFPEDATIYSKLGYIYMQADYQGYDPVKALQLLETSLKTLPDNIFALYNSGMLLLQARRFAEAQTRFERAFALNPLMAYAYERAGEAALAQGKRDLAISYFRRTLEIQHDQMDAKRHLESLGVTP
jgi:tetratricopeptide (TPR) repeat protein